MSFLKTTGLILIFFGISNIAQSQIITSLIDIETNELVRFNDIYDQYDLNEYNEMLVITWSGVWCNNACVKLIDRYQKVDTSMVSIITVNIDSDEDIDGVLEQGYHLNWDKSINFKNYDFDKLFNTDTAPLILNVFDGWITDAFVSYTYYPYQLMLDEGYDIEFIWNSGDDLNEAAWYIYINDISDYFDDALDWVKRSIELDTNYSNTDTYAALLFKKEDYTTALKTAKHAIDIAKENGIDYSTTSDLINKIIEKM